MATKRRPLHRPLTARITPEIVALFVRIRQVQDSGLDHREMHDLTAALHAGLGLCPWDDDPLWVPPHGEPPRWVNAERWRKAQALRRALDDAARERG